MVYLINMRSFTSIKLYKINLLGFKKHFAFVDDYHLDV